MSVREKPWFPIVYMFVLTAFFSAILLGFSTFTRDRVEANEKLSFEKAVLTALPVVIPPGTSNRALHEMFVASVKEPDASSAGAYRLVEDGQLVAYAVPFEGQGFWDVIRGIIGVAADGRTITGIAFYYQRETPGLGGEIVKPRFCDQFAEGKVLGAGERVLELKPEKESAGPSEVNQITGATQTSTRLGRILNERLADWREAMAGRAGR